MNFLLDTIRGKNGTDSKLDRKKIKADSERERLVQVGKEQFERLVERGLSIPIATM